MRRQTVAIRLSSPLIEEGIRNVLQTLDCVAFVSDIASDDISLAIADPFTIGVFGADVRSIGVLTGAVPDSVRSVFDDTVDIYETREEIIRKVSALLAPEPKDPRCSELSPRERDVILQIVKGLSNKEIAANMNVSVNTVMTHRRNIASKLKIHSPAGLTIFAIATGLVKMEDITG